MVPRGTLFRSLLGVLSLSETRSGCIDGAIRLGLARAEYGRRPHAQPRVGDQLSACDREMAAHYRALAMEHAEAGSRELADEISAETVF